MSSNPFNLQITNARLIGYTQSGPLFDSKTKALTKLLTKTLSAAAPIGLAVEPVFIFPTGPHRLRPRDIPGFVPANGDDGDDGSDDDSSDAWAWFRKNEVNGTYRGFEDGMKRIAESIAEAGGDIDGVIGFSQGGCTAALIAAALEQNSSEGGEDLAKKKMMMMKKRVPGPDVPSPSAETLTGSPPDWTWVDNLRAANNNRALKFAVIYSGFWAPVPGLQWLYEDPPIVTPTCHFIGSLDTVVEEARCQALIDRCADPQVIVHTGGHYVPVAKQWAIALLGFIKKIYEQEGKKGGAEEESQERL